jgi:serine/threonine-protein kinase
VQPTDPYLGQVILNYRLIRKLGAGGFGAVYEAEHEGIGRRAACKILHREFAGHDEVVERFFREARTVCAIGHPAIIEIENFGRLPTGEPFYLMELFSGRSLADRVHGAPLAPADAIAIFDPVASALAAAHGKGVVHRDLKPENIMIAEDAAGRVTSVKLLDFGIAKLSSAADQHLSRSGMPMGTPAYMAPEQARDAKSVDARADVYAFAATVFTCLTGRPPFHGDSLAELILKVQIDAPPPLRTFIPQASPELEHLLATCMAKDPRERPADVAAAWAAMRQAMLGASTWRVDVVPVGHADTDLHPHAVAPPLGSQLPGWEVRPSHPHAPTVVASPSGATALASPGATASASSGGTTAPARRRGGVLVAVGLVAAAAVAGIVVVATSGGAASPAPSPAAQVSPDGGGGGAVVAVAAAPDAAPPPPPAPDAAPLPVDAGRPPPPDPIDAGRPPRLDAGVRRPPRVDAGVRPPRTDAGPPADRRCTRAAFARIYDQDAPSFDDVQRALDRLKACAASGALDERTVKAIQDRLIQKL